MKLLLYCDNDPRDLGIEDAQGKWDWDKFREHVEVCPVCSRFKALMGDDLLEHLEDAFGGEGYRSITSWRAALLFPG